MYTRYYLLFLAFVLIAFSCDDSIETPTTCPLEECIIDYDQDCIIYDSLNVEKHFFRSSGTLAIDVNNDGQEDLTFHASHDHALGGSLYQFLEVDVLNTNVELIASPSLDTIIEYARGTNHIGPCVFRLNKLYYTAEATDSIISEQAFDRFHIALNYDLDSVCYESTSFKSFSNALLWHKYSWFPNHNHYCGTSSYRFGEWAQNQDPFYLVFRMRGDMPQWGYIEMKYLSSSMEIIGIGRTYIEE